MFREADEKIPLKKALSYVALSVIIIWGSLLTAWLIHRAILVKRSSDPRYTIVALVQTSQGQHTLQNWQISELLDLSRDRPQNLYKFDTKEAEARLMNNSCFQRATVRRQPPGIILVDYLLREPVAHLGEYSNVAVDKELFPFALRPFFTPKNLPVLFIGANDLCYFSPLASDEAQLAFKVLDAAQKAIPYPIKSIDTRNAYKRNAGLQEVIVVINEGEKERFLRMKPCAFEKTLKEYALLQPTFASINQASPTQIVDLRTPSIALVK